MRQALFFVLLSAGCVTQGTYDALRAEQDATLEALSARNAALEEREKRIAALERDGAALRQAIDSEKASAAELQRRIDKLKADLSAVVKDKSSLQASVVEMTEALAELQKRKDEAEARIAEYRNLLAKFRTLIDAGKLAVKIVDGRMVVVLNTDVLFGSGSATLSMDGKGALGEVATLLASIPDRAFQIEGHTDNVPISTAQYPSNWELASARAITVLKTMVEAGLPPQRISAASFGDSKPAASNETAEGKAANRRIEIIIVPDLSTLPGFEELKRLEKDS